MGYAIDSPTTEVSNLILDLAIAEQGTAVVLVNDVAFFWFVQNQPQIGAASAKAAEDEADGLPLIFLLLDDLLQLG